MKGFSALILGLIGMASLMLAGCNIQGSTDAKKLQAIKSQEGGDIGSNLLGDLSTYDGGNSTVGLANNILVMEKKITTEDLDRAFDEVNKISGIDYRKGYLGMTDDERKRIPDHILREIKSGWLIAGRPSSDYLKKKRYVDEKIDSCKKTLKELGYVKSEHGINTGLVMICGQILPPPYAVECRRCKKGEKGCEWQELLINNVPPSIPCCGKTASEKELTKKRNFAELTKGTKEWIAKKRTDEFWKCEPKIRKEIQGLFPNMNKDKLARIVKKKFEEIPYVKVLSVKPAFGESGYRFGYTIKFIIEGSRIIRMIDIFPKQLPPDHPQTVDPEKVKKYMTYMKGQCKMWAYDIIMELKNDKCVYDLSNAIDLEKVLNARAIRESSLDRYRKYEMLNFINFLWCPECNISNMSK